MRGKEFIDQIVRRMESEGESTTDKRVASRLGMSAQSLMNWRKRDSITPRQIAQLLERVEEIAVKDSEKKSIIPIVEFFAIDHKESDRSNRVQILDTDDEGGDDHPYKLGIKKQLNEHRGVYIFYDSRGRGLYVGQAKTQSLWAEMNSAFNRERQLQKIRKTNHPDRKQEFRTYDEIRRQITERNVPLCDLAQYFSAYSVVPGMISNLEAFLVRGFANDLLNKKMENFKP